MKAGVQPVDLDGRLAGEDIDNDVSKVEVNRSNFKHISATDNVVSGPGRLFGIFVSSNTSGNITVYDGSADSDPEILAQFNVADATMYDFGSAIEFGEGLRVKIGGTVECTVLYRKDIS